MTQVVRTGGLLLLIRFEPLFSTLTNNNADGSALHAKLLTNLVLQIPLVGKVEQLRLVAEKYKCRRLGRGLGHVVNFKALTLVGGGLYTGCGVSQ